MADAGVFRLRAVLVGTVAFHAYAAMLGIKLGPASFTTEDVDVAQFRSISIAVEDETPDMLNILRQVDPDYEALPSLYPMAPPTRYRTRGVKVEFLTLCVVRRRCSRWPCRRLNRRRAAALPRLPDLRRTACGASVRRRDTGERAKPRPLRLAQAYPVAGPHK
ncbi:GSU2403 family nucleotidyltransferase fold protein [Pseudoroseomonas wenyumeiae]